MLEGMDGAWFSIPADLSAAGRWSAAPAITECLLWKHATAGWVTGSFVELLIAPYSRL